VLLVAAAAIVGGAVLAALGRAGEMAIFTADAPPFDPGQVTATDVALLRPPLSLWGYNAPATEEALRVIARAMTARDVEIARLRLELANAQAGRSASWAAPPVPPAGSGWAAPPGSPGDSGWAAPPGQPGDSGRAALAGPLGEADQAAPAEHSPEAWRLPEHHAGE
jgi:hypothetical protein